MIGRNVDWSIFEVEERFLGEGYGPYGVWIFCKAF